ncbi:hypothetical protein [uncultured Paracoccus sp.]|nr:hypothetical protein [uncultured Paracoccus sp.]
MVSLLVMGACAGLPWLIKLGTVALFLLVLRRLIFFGPFTPFSQGWLFWLFGPAVDGVPVRFTGVPRGPDLRDCLRRP